MFGLLLGSSLGLSAQTSNVPADSISILSLIEEVEENTVDLPLTEDLNMDMSVSGAPMPGMRMKPEKKMVLPRKKVTAKIKRQDSSAPLTISSADLADAAPGVAFSGQELDVQESTSGNGDEKLS